MDNDGESAALRELDAAIREAIWRYAEAATGLNRNAPGKGDPLLGRRRIELARVTAARHAAQFARAAESNAATAAIGHGATFPMLADAAGITRQVAWKRYRPR